MWYTWNLHNIENHLDLNFFLMKKYIKVSRRFSSSPQQEARQLAPVGSSLAVKMRTTLFSWFFYLWFNSKHIFSTTFPPVGVDSSALCVPSWHSSIFFLYLLTPVSYLTVGWMLVGNLLFKQIECRERTPNTCFSQLQMDKKRNPSWYSNLWLPKLEWASEPQVGQRR